MSGKNKPFDRLILAFCSVWLRFADNIYRSLKSVLFDEVPAAALGRHQTSSGKGAVEMPKFKQPLAQHPLHQWGTRMGGAANIEPGFLASELKNDVVSVMANQYGIEVNAKDDEITTGGLFSSTSFPGVEFSFAGHSDWARFLVGISKTAAIISIDVIQQGSVSSGMQRMNSASSKGMFSISGALQKAMTDQNAVETESMYYGTLLQTIQQVVESWME